MCLTTEVTWSAARSFVTVKHADSKDTCGQEGVLRMLEGSERVQSQVSCRYVGVSSRRPRFQYSLGDNEKSAFLLPSPTHWHLSACLLFKRKACFSLQTAVLALLLAISWRATERTGRRNRAVPSETGRWCFPHSICPQVRYTRVLECSVSLKTERGSAALWVGAICKQPTPVTGSILPLPVPQPGLYSTHNVRACRIC